MRAALLLAAVSLVGCTRLTPRLVTFDGRAVEVATAGSGRSTVVFEAGLGADWSVWDDVAAEVAGSSRVFAYSRPGAGRSAAANTPRDAHHLVEELRAVLALEGLAPPYVLVGHSFGGTWLEFFARTHRDEVSALVLVDPRPAAFAEECEARGLSGCSLSAQVVRSLPSVQQAEIASFADVRADLATAGALGDFPVRVLTATSHGERPEWEVLWRSMLATLADEAVDGQQLVFEGAGHNLQLERPRAVARVIIEVAR